MQRVEGSSPFIRFAKPAGKGGFLFFRQTTVGFAGSRNGHGRRVRGSGVCVLVRGVARCEKQGQERRKFGIVANDQGFGVTFATIIPESGGTAMSGENRLWLSDIARALDMSTTLHRVLAQRGTQQALST